MAQPYVGEIRIFAGNFAPAGWALCQGQPLAISENETLFQLIGTTYGGDGESTFNLPNMSSRVPVHMGNGPDGQTYQISEMAGVETVTLTTQQIPAHTHPFTASLSPGTSNNPGSAVVGSSPSVMMFYGLTPADAMHPQSIGPTGGSQPHENMQPFLCLNFIISLFGIFPSPT